MSKKYETLDEYLDELDKVKEQLAKELEGMDVKDRIAHINQSRDRLKKKLRKWRAQKSKRQVQTTKK